MEATAAPDLDEAAVAEASRLDQPAEAFAEAVPDSPLPEVPAPVAESAGLSDGVHVPDAPEIGDPVDALPEAGASDLAPDPALPETVDMAVAETPAAEPEPLPVLEDDAEDMTGTQQAQNAAHAGQSDLSADEFEPAAENKAEVDPEPDPEPELVTATATAAAAYAVDESVLAILREEAERESQARRADAAGLESQTDLGLDAAMPGRSKAKPMAAEEQDLTLKPSARRDLLPDVEEINSTLRPSEVPVEEFVQPSQPQREAKGFRGGFLMVMTVAILATALYTAAPRLSAMVPFLAGPLDGYVRVIDSLRLSLDGVMQSATMAINGG